MDILSEIKENREIQLQKEKNLYKKPSFKDALKQEGLKIIGEIKRASPSKGKIVDNSFNLLNQAKHYAENGVAAFSILTEEEYFKLFLKTSLIFQYCERTLYTLLFRWLMLNFLELLQYFL